MFRYVALENGDMALCDQGAWVEYREVEKLQKQYMELLRDYDTQKITIQRLHYKIKIAKEVLLDENS